MCIIVNKGKSDIKLQFWLDILICQNVLWRFIWLQFEQLPAENVFVWRHSFWAQLRFCLLEENKQTSFSLFSYPLSISFLNVTCIWLPAFCKQKLSHMGKRSAFERKLIILNNCVCAEPVCSQAGMARSTLLLMVSTWTLREAGQDSSTGRNLQI